MISSAQAAANRRTWVSLFLLGALLLSQATRPLMHSSLARASWSVLVLTLALWATLQRPLTRTLGVVLALVASGLALGGDREAQAGALLGGALITAFTSIALLDHVLRQREVRTSTLCDALSVYLMLVQFFGLIYGLIEELQPGSFGGLPVNSDLELGRELVLEALSYFSLVTLTTLGYGDVVPIGVWARTMAGLQALVGQFFLVVLVARLVALHASSSGRGK